MSSNNDGKNSSSRKMTIVKREDQKIIKTLLKRRDFLSVNKGARVSTPGFLLLALKRTNKQNMLVDDIRVGYTCSKKVGNAVTRNKAKRRLRALVRTTLPGIGLKCYDYVLIGKYSSTNKLSFETLQNDLKNSIIKLHQNSQKHEYN